MKHVLLSPHPDDAALSCGGLIELLHRRGDEIAIVSVYSGAGDLDDLTPYQREALGFGKVEPAGGPDKDDRATDSADGRVPLTPRRVMAFRRSEDEAYARFAGAAGIFLDLPDAVFRGYAGDEQLMGVPRPDDPPRVEALRNVLAGLGPDRLYVPMGVGGHVDHRLVRNASMTLVADPDWLPPAAILFYEDFPYAFRLDFTGPLELDSDELAGLPPGATLACEFTDVESVLERKLEGIRKYASQLDRLFGGDAAMTAAIRAQAKRIGECGGLAAAERYWRLDGAVAAGH